MEVIIKCNIIMPDKIDFNLKKPDTIPLSFYWEPNYLTPTRLSSIGHQWKLAIETNTTKFIEIGIGSGLLTEMLRAKSLSVTTLDISFQLNPQIVGKIPFLPFPNKFFETCLCYEVLEHLPFNSCIDCLKEMNRITTKTIILSLPDQDGIPHHKNIIAIIKKIVKGKGIERQISEEHCWELGYHNINAATIINMATDLGLSLLFNFRNPINPYHHFFAFRLP
jgi:2-polyprenyl-3-methyl-5-hydroxy-6-metoxy-1,4-benzoquinol methylase